MKMIIIILMLSSFVHASNLDCQTYVNLESVSQSFVQTTLNQKILVHNTERATTYLTENDDHQFVLEAFIPSLQIRIYSEAKVKDVQDSIKVSLWERDLIFDIVCKKIKP